MGIQSKKSVLWGLAVVLGMLYPGWVWADIVWSQNFKTAQSQAATANKDIFLYFADSNGCEGCTKLESEIYSQEDFQEETRSRFVFVKVDDPNRKDLSSDLKDQNSDLREKFTKQYRLDDTYPTIYLTDSNGVPYAKIGYMEGGVEVFNEHLTLLQRIRPMVDPSSSRMRPLRSHLCSIWFRILR